MDYIERLVLNLKKNYSKDELVAHLMKVEKELKIEKGILQSEVEELKHNNKELKKALKRATQSSKEVRNSIKKERLYIQLEEQCEQLRLKCIRIQSEHDRFVSRCIGSQNKLTTKTK